MLIDIRELAPRPKGTLIRLPLINERLSTVNAYRAILNEVIRAIAKIVKEDILPTYRQDLLTTDSASWFNSLKSAVSRLVSIATGKMETLVRGETDRVDKRVASGIKIQLGADVSSLFGRQNDSPANDIIDRNAALIRSLANESVTGIEREVLTAKLKLKPVSKLRESLRTLFKRTRTRAKLIAKDQMSKLVTDVTRSRQVSIGVSEYAWWTVLDERVRRIHRLLHSNVYKYGEPTGSENGLEPGQEVNCRCKAIAIIRY